MCDAAADTDCWIENATSSTYTPTADDAGSKLTAVVTYEDAFVTDSDGDPATGDKDDDGDTARLTSDNAAKVRPDENAQPTFGDDESVDRSVAENANKRQRRGAGDGDRRRQRCVALHAKRRRQ